MFSDVINYGVDRVPGDPKTKNIQTEDLAYFYHKVVGWSSGPICVLTLYCTAAVGIYTYNATLALIHSPP